MGKLICQTVLYLIICGLICFCGAQFFTNETKPMLIANVPHNSPSLRRNVVFNNKLAMKDKKITWDDLKLINEHYERKIGSKTLFKDATLSIDRKKELSHCDQYTQDTRKAMDCRSLEAHRSGKNVSSKSYCDSFVRKTSLKLKLKLDTLFLPDLTMDLTVLPKIGHSVNYWNDAWLSQAGSPFIDPIKLGVFYEFNVTNPFDKHKLISCHGVAFGAINQTEPLPKSKPEPKFFQEIPYYIGQATQNGYFLHLPVIECFEPGQESKFSVRGTLTIMKQAKFPYLDARLDFVTKPDERVLKFVGAIKQAPGEPNQPIIYTTDNIIVATSSLFPMLNVRYYKRFFNEHPLGGIFLENGRSTSQMLVNKYGALLGNTRWIDSAFSNNLNWYSTSKEFDTQQEMDAIEEAQEDIKFSYRNDVDNQDEHVMKLKIKKDLIPESIIGNLVAHLNSFESLQPDVSVPQQPYEFMEVGPKGINLNLKDEL